MSSVSSGRDKTRTKNILGTGMQAPTQCGWMLWCINATMLERRLLWWSMLSSKCSVQSPVTAGVGTTREKKRHTRQCQYAGICTVWLAVVVHCCGSTGGGHHYHWKDRKVILDWLILSQAGVGTTREKKGALVSSSTQASARCGCMLWYIVATMLEGVVVIVDVRHRD